jgi:DNA-binding NarL/FixJ family response regulator
MSSATSLHRLYQTSPGLTCANCCPSAAQRPPTRGPLRNLDEYVFAALRAGASGFLLKDVPPADLLTGIRAAAAGDAVVAPNVTRRLLDAFAGHLPDPSTGQLPSHERLHRLTDREREVLTEVARGHSNGEIAQLLTVSEETVKTHVGRILAKLGLRDRVQMVVFACEAGIVRPGTD